MKEIYNTPNIEIIELSAYDVVATSQLSNNGTLDWDNVDKPTWGNGTGWN